MLWTTPPQSVSKNITCTSVRTLGGALAMVILANDSRSRVRKQRYPDEEWNVGISELVAENRYYSNTLLLHLTRDHLLNARDNFSARHCTHATEVERAFPQKTRTAFDMVPKNPVTRTKWRGALRFG